MGKFTKDTITTFITRILTFIFGIAASIIIARTLGPEKKGIFTLAKLLPTLIVIFINLGISPATVYHIGKKKYKLNKIRDHNLLYTALIGGTGIIIGILIIILGKNLIFKEVQYLYLLTALILIPFTLFYQNVVAFLQGLQKFKNYNLSRILKSFLFILLIGITLLAFKMGIIGVLIASILSILFTGIITYQWVKKEIKKKPQYKIDTNYTKSFLSYGLKAYGGNIIGFLNYRLDLFLVSALLSPLAVGFYSLAVGIGEKIWILSKTVSTVLFPKVASEKNKKKRKNFTPIVTRNVLFITILGCTLLFIISKWVIGLLYSESYLPSVAPLQILLPGIIALSIARIISNDIAGRGKPIINTYVGGLALISNIGLNILWIPKIGIQGAALASTVSYNINLIIKLIIYKNISGNKIKDIIFPKKSDLKLYKKFLLKLKNKILPH